MVLLLLQTLFADLTQALWEHDYAAADQAAYMMRRQTHGLRMYCDDTLSHASKKLQCCELVHVLPRKTSGAFVYGVVLLIAVGTYLLVNLVSNLTSKRRYVLAAGR